MKEKIIARLKAYLATLNVRNLSAARINAIAEKLADKITDENLIDERLTAINEVTPFADIAKQDDQLRDAQAKLKTKEKQDPQKDPADPIEPVNVPADVPEWAKTMLEQNKKLVETVAKLESRTTADTQRSRMRAMLKEKKVSDAYLDDPFRKMAIESKTFKDDDELNAFVDQVVAEYSKQAQTTTNEQLQQQPAPVMGVVKDEKKDVSPLMEGYLKDKKGEEKKTA